MHLLDQLPGCGAQAQRDPLTSVPTYASATTGRVCAPEHHTHDKEAGDGSRGSQLAYDELAVKLLRGPSFFSRSVPRAVGSTHACTRIQPPLHMTALPIRRFWTNTRQLRCGQRHPFPWPHPRRCLHGDQAFVLSCCSIGSATDTHVHIHVNVHN